MSQVIIYSYGVAEFTAAVLNAVASIVNDPSFDTLMKATLLIAGFIAAAQYSYTRHWSVLASCLIRYSVVMALLLIPKYTVTVHDSVMQNDYPVGNVPLGLALPASIVTTIFHYLTTTMETAFHWTNDESYNKTGFLFASQILKNSYNVQIMDANFKKSLDSFIAQCVFYDIYLGAYTIKDLLNSDNIWGLITSRPSANRAFMLDGVVTVCSAGAPLLSEQWSGMIDNTAEKYMKIILPAYQMKSKLNQNTDLKAMLFNGIGLGHGALTGIARNGAEILKQNLMINALQSVALNNPDLGMRSYAVTKANLQKAVGNNDMGYMMASWLPAMMGVVESMIYSLFPLIILFCLFTGGEKVIGNYIMSMIWVGCWPLIFAVLNFGFTWYTQSKAQGYGISYYDMHYLNNLQFQMSSLFGYFTMAVPFLAKGLLNLGKQGLDATFTHMSQLIGGSTQSLAMSASGETVSGNLSMGNTSFDNHSMHNMNGYKYDTNSNFASGAMSTQLASGSMLTQTSDGASVLNMAGSLSNLNPNINMLEQISAAASMQSERALNATKNDQRNISENTTSADRSLYDIGTNINKGTAVGQDFNINTSGGYAEAVSEYAVAIDRFAQENNLSKQDAGRLLRGAYLNGSTHVNVDSDKQAAGKLLSLAAGISGGAGISTGLKFEGDHSWTTQDSENYSKAQEFLKNNNYTNTFEKAYKGMESNSYHADSKEGQSLTNSMSASLDKAVQASQSYNAHMQESIGYREVANYSKNQSASVNYSANQEFIEYIAKQPLYSGQGAMGINQAEALLRTNPELRQAYTEQFVKQKTQDSFHKWKTEHINPSAVASAGADFMNDIQKQQSNVRNNYESNKNTISNSELGVSLNKVKIDESTKNTVKSIINDSQKDVNEVRAAIYKTGDNIELRANSKIKNNVDTQSNYSKFFDSDPVTKLTEPTE